MAPIFSRSVTKIFLSWVTMSNILSMEGVCAETVDKIDNCQIFPMNIRCKFHKCFWNLSVCNLRVMAANCILGLPIRTSNPDIYTFIFIYLYSIQNMQNFEIIESALVI